MAGCYVLGRWVWTSWVLSSPLGSSLSSSSSPCPPQQKSIWWRRAREEEGVVAIFLGVDTVPLSYPGGAGKTNKRMFSWLSLSTTSLKTVFFCKNGYSYKKNKIWRSSVHVQLNSMCTDDCLLMNKSSSATGKRMQFCNHGGGGISMVSKLEAVC
jgi:hypothetical protein